MRLDLNADLEALVPPGRKPQKSPIGSLAFDPTGTLLAVGLSGHAARALVYELPDREKRESYRLDHTYDGAFFPDEDADDDEGIGTDFGFFSTIGCSFSPDGRWLAVHHANPNHGNVIDLNLEIFDRVRGQLVVGLGPRDEEGVGLALGVSAYAWLPVGGGLCVATFDGGISVWRLSPRATVRAIERPLDVEVPPVLAMAVDTSGTRLGVVRAGALEIRDLTSGGAALKRVDLGVDPTAGGHVTARFVGGQALIAWAEDDEAQTLVVDLSSGQVHRLDVGEGGALGAALIDRSGGSVLWDREEEGQGRRVLVRQHTSDGAIRAIQRRWSTGGAEGAVAVSPLGERVARAVGTTIVISRIGRKPGRGR